MADNQQRSLSGMIWGPQDPGSATDTGNIDSAFVYETSGKAAMCMFNSPLTQSGATLTIYVFVTAVTGTPDFQMEVRDSAATSGDPDRPLPSASGGSNLASSPSTLSLTTSDVNKWKALSCTVSLTAGKTYFVIIKNTNGTPASNNAAFRYRGALDSFDSANNGSWYYGMVGGFTTTGFTTDPTIASAVASMVIKFSDGTLLGNPYVGTASLSSNTSSRGNRVVFAANVTVSGIICGLGTSSALSGAGIYKTDGTTILAATADEVYRQRSGILRFAPVTLLAGVSYDVVVNVGSATSLGQFYTMVEAEGSVASDVLACRPCSIAAVVGTPGSMTVDTSRILFVCLLIDGWPAASGGGLLRHPGMTGGANA